MKQVKKSVLNMVLSTIIIMILLQLIISISGAGSFRYQLMNSGTQAVRKDSSGNITGYHLKGIDWVLSYGDTLEITLELPEEAPWEGHCSIVMFEYNALVDVWCGGKQIFSGEHDIAERGKMIGNEMISFPVPDDAWGDTIEISLTSCEKSDSSFNVPIRLMPSEEVRLSPMIGHTLQFVLFAIILVLSLFFTIRNLLTSVAQKKPASGLWLFLFGLLVSTWYLGYNRAFYIFSSATRLNELVEYYAMYLTVIPLMFYFAEISTERWFRRLSEILAVIFTADAVISIALAFSPAPVDLSDTVRVYRVLVIVTFGVFLLRTIMTWKKKVTQEKIILNGLALSMLIIAFEIIAVTLRSNTHLPGWLYPVLYFDYASAGILLYIAIIYILYFSRVEDERQYRIKKKELEKLAFADQMTGIPNRAYLMHKISEMKELPDGFTAVFLDVDRLKTANDSFGHETGDRLIRTVAESIRTAYRKAGGDGDMYGRWGGDEFIAYFANRSMADEFQKILADSLAEINSEHLFDFDVDISVGMATADSTGKDPENPQTPEELLEAADRRMYERKALHHRRDGMER